MIRFSNLLLLVGLSVVIFAAFHHDWGIALPARGGLNKEQDHSHLFD
jgi:hypothetical protein